MSYRRPFFAKPTQAKGADAEGWPRRLSFAWASFGEFSAALQSGQWSIDGDERGDRLEE